MRTLLAVSTFVLLLSSCMTQRACNRKFPPAQFDRTTVEIKSVPVPITLRIPPVKIAGGSEIVIKEGECTALPSHLETEFAFSRAWIENGQIRHTLNQKGIMRTDTVYREIPYYITEKSTTVEVNVLRWWQTALMWSGVVLIVLVVVRVWFSR